MRFAAAIVAVLVCSSVYAATPNAAIDPSANYFKIDMTRPPPPPAPVYVLNWPDVQAVAGTVSVDNLPAVQAVGGTVNVSNLPLDADGAVRVTSAPAKQMVCQELLTEPMIVAEATLLPAVVNVDGFQNIGITVAPGYGEVTMEPFYRWSPDSNFMPVVDARIGVGTGGPFVCSGWGNRLLVCPTSGGDVRVQLADNAGAARTLTSVRVCHG